MTISDTARGAQSGQPIYRSNPFTIWPDRVVEGAYSARVLSPTEIVSNYPKGIVPVEAKSRWKLDADISEYPELRSSIPLVDALYNLSLEELQKDTRADGAFNAGAKWQGVWTRDTSYSVLLSLAAIQPDAARASLLHRVNNDRIVQDTGTGGSWPVSTDRVIWGLAAWEIYLVTGDHEWLQHSHAVLRNSVLDDEHVLLDPATGLAYGESSFLDWREQTYPRWMEPADIYASKALGTNAVYYRAYRILALMAQQLGQPAQHWNARADRIRAAINEHYWQKDRGYYGQYLYGRIWQTLSPRPEALGESLSILFDIASPEQQDEILRSQPLMDYGIPTVFPATPDIPAYHNRSVWPFVQSFWNLAAAKRQNETALLHGLASIYRASALFLTNKENFVADTGSPAGTAINSDRQLWSVAGNLAMVYRAYFGMEFAPDGLHLHPVIPEALGGTRILSNFRYRNAALTVEVHGFGGQGKSFLLDGKSSSAILPADLAGEHTVVIEMDNLPLRTAHINREGNTIAPETPELCLDEDTLTWNAVKGAGGYQVYRNGKPFATTSSTNFSLPATPPFFSHYQVTAVDNAGIASFLSAPACSGTFPILVPALAPVMTPALPPGSPSFVTLDSEGSTQFSVTASVPTTGIYALSFRYANGSGPITTGNKCAIRTLFVDGREIGAIVFPQRGENAWEEWGASNIREVHLSSGAHCVELRMMPYDRNMNGTVNRALVSSVTLLFLG